LSDGALGVVLGFARVETKVNLLNAAQLRLEQTRISLRSMAFAERSPRAIDTLEL
jgi:hypothetical protein